MMHRVCLKSPAIINNSSVMCGPPLDCLLGRLGGFIWSGRTQEGWRLWIHPSEAAICDRKLKDSV